MRVSIGIYCDGHKDEVNMGWVHCPVTYEVFFRGNDSHDATQTTPPTSRPSTKSNLHYLSSLTPKTNNET